MPEPMTRRAQDHEIRDVIDAAFGSRLDMVNFEITITAAALAVSAVALCEVVS